MADALVPFSFRHQSSIPKIMGILNVTPDSFHASSRQENGNKAISNGLSMIDEGATILDIGGESTRPGSDEVSIEKELERVLPVITGLREASKNRTSFNRYSKS